MPGQLVKNIIAGDRVLVRWQGDGCTGVVRVVERGPLAALVLLVVLLVLAPARVWLVILAAVGTMVGICFWWAVRGSRRVRLSRRLLHTWVQVGDHLEESFTLQNDSLLPILAAEIEDHSDLPGYNGSTVRALTALGQEHWNQRAISQRRGIFHLGPTTVRFADPLGIFEVTCEYLNTREVLVFPPVLHNLAVSLPSGGGQGVTISRQRNVVDTAVIGGLRDYQPGDPVRRIHWPLSIRHQALLVKEFDDEKGSDIWLALDLDQTVHAGEGQESTLEYAIIWTASWTWHLLKQGKGVGLYTYGPERIVIPPAKGTAQLWRVLRVLAPLEACAATPLAGLLREVQPFLGRGSSLIIITPSMASDWPLELARPGLRTAARGVVLLDANSFYPEIPQSAQAESEAEPAVQPPAGGAGSSLAWLRTMLASLGVPVHLVQRRGGLDARPAAPGTGHWDYLVTPWGKVVVRSSPARVEP